MMLSLPSNHCRADVIMIFLQKKTDPVLNFIADEPE